MSVGSWILLWTVLVLAALIFHAVVLFRVGLKGKRVYDAALEAGGEFSSLLDEKDRAAREVAGADSAGVGALFVDPEHAREIYAESREAGREARRRRRIDNKRLRGQPQRYGDLYGL
ncbi:hypothetical protein [Zhihengliuella salsuginis]|uniref:Uncharacterized protein n=1 Tax=Zhihengliuella salsuginis TaxID=578222 RepID=A0ABQ3GN40_9MICC|nr:hypothetical protein [Zhihengliuella salsuginis]GHD12716.1 hypothetical protein GCM10008096_28360 [Zhihengliuella salsuginis]